MSTQDPSQRPNLGKETPWDAPGAPEQHPGGAGQQPTPPGTGSAPPPGYGTPAAPPPGYGTPAPPPPGYGTPTQGYAPAPVGYGIQGKTRGPWAVWLLSIITFGIYFLVWYYKINNEA
ncbi:MAG: DUF4234 domain-containing protein, partial [Frankiaceae bacterium]